jgi:RIO kinase 1
MKHPARYLDFEDEEDYWPRRNGNRLNGAHRAKPKPHNNVAELAEAGDDTRSGFNPTFTSSRHEREWIIGYLGEFYEDQIIGDVLHQVKGGKEATVYCCRAYPGRDMELIAAKIYRPRMFRSMKNDQLYREGGDIADDSGQSAFRSRRAKVAMRKKTEFGHTLLHNAWLRNEYTTLQRLHAAGALVPQPYAVSENVILMEYMGDIGNPAPPLINIRLDRAEARPLFNALIENLDIMLAHNIVHGDLSAHNILYWEGEVRIIDFPQAVASHVNPSAQMIFRRDVERLCQYFERYGVESDPLDLARELWTRHLPE